MQLVGQIEIMNNKALISFTIIAFALFLRVSSASGTETFDCSINQGQWELMAHYSKDEEIRDIILFISNTEKFIYHPKENEAKFDNRAQYFSVNITSTDDRPSLEILISKGKGRVIFNNKEYDIKCMWLTD